jgi:hypothetical protein
MIDNDEDEDSDKEEDSDNDSDSELEIFKKPVIEKIKTKTQRIKKIEESAECNSDCGCDEDCDCDAEKKCPKTFPKRPHKVCECAKCQKWDSDGVPAKTHKEWNCDCTKCKEWMQAYFLVLHPKHCECKYCAFVSVRLPFIH